MIAGRDELLTEGRLGAGFLGRKALPGVNVAGSPTHPGRGTETRLMLAGDTLAAGGLDGLARPRFHADQLVQHGCRKNAFHEDTAPAGQLAEISCMMEHPGCVGTQAVGDCSTRAWNGAGACTRGNGPCIRCTAPDDTQPHTPFTRTPKVAGIPVGPPSGLPKARFAARASLAQAATPRRIALKRHVGPDRRGAHCREARDVTATRRIAGPVNRVEGDLQVRPEINGVRVPSPLHRGCGRTHQGRDPGEAPTLVPRNSGIGSIRQPAAARALAPATGVTPVPQGERVAALIRAVENRADHPTQFALFAMPDFSPPADAADAWLGEVSACRAALAARARFLRIMGLLAGSWPQMLAIQPGWVTRAPGLRGFRRDLGDHPFGAPVEAFAALGWGEAAHPCAGRTDPDADRRKAAHAWCKAPRRAGSPMQTGAIARQVNDGHPLAQEPAREGAVLARVAGRPLDLARRQPVIEALVSGIRPEERFIDRRAWPAEARGEKLVEAARGAPGHGQRVEKRPIAFCRIVAPTGWNFGPRDAAGVPDPPEAAPEGAELAPGETRPHLLRSFGPCMAGTVH